MKSLSSIIVAGVSAVALLAAVPVSAQDNAPVSGDKRMLPHNPMNTEPLNPPGPAGSRNDPAAGTGPDSTGAAGTGPGATGAVGSNEAVGALGGPWVPVEGDVAAEDLIGADVVSYHNWIIGEVESTTVVDGRTAYIVSVDEELGMGSRVISIHEDHTSVFRNSGNMNELRIAVNVTQDQIRQQPDYRSEGSMRDNPNNPGQTR